MNAWHPEITNAQHHGGGYITSSLLKAALGKTPAYFKAYRDGEMRVESAAFAMGTLVHCAVLTPDQWDAEVAVCPMDDSGNRLPKTSKANKEVWAEFEANIGTRTVCTPQEYEDSQRVAEAVRDNPQAAEWLSCGIAEVTGLVDDLAGTAAIRPDLRNVLGAYIVDLKTTTDASPEAVQRSMVNFGYALSAAWYVDLAGILDKQVYDFVWVYVEKAYPYNVQCYRAERSLLDAGRVQYEQALRNIRDFAETRNYPASYAATTLPMEMPRWYK